MARQVHSEEEKSVALGAAQHVHDQTQAWMQQAQGREDVLRASIPGSDGNYAPEWMELQQCDT